MSNQETLQSLDNFVDVVRDTFERLSHVVANLIEAQELLAEGDHPELRELIASLDGFDTKMSEAMYSTFHSMVSLRSALEQNSKTLYRLNELLLKIQHGGRVR